MSICGYTVLFITRNSILNWPFTATVKRNWIHMLTNPQSDTPTERLMTLICCAPFVLKQKWVLAHSSVMSKIHPRVIISRVLGLLQNEGKGGQKRRESVRTWTRAKMSQIGSKTKLWTWVVCWFRDINYGPWGLTVCGGNFQISVVAHAEMT